MAPRKSALYYKAYETLKGRIASGAYKPGDLLPPERELCAAFGINRVTLRRGLEMLENEGMIKKHAGVGTEVLPGAGIGGGGYIGYILYSGAGENRLDEPFQASLFYQVERDCARYGYNLIFKTVRDGDRLKDVFSGTNISFVIFSSQMPERFLAEAVEMGLRACVVNSVDERFVSIQSDNFDGAAAVVRYLWKKGHRKIALVTGPPEYQTSKQRLSGCLSALKALGGEAESVFPGSWGYEAGIAAGKKIASLGKAERPDAVFAFNDRSAMGVIAALREGNVPVPGEISVMGFDNIQAAEETVPPLTTVDADIRAFSAAIIQQVRFSFDGGTVPPLNIIVRSKIRERNSVSDISGKTPDKGEK